jgi:predicted transcriptional regulator
LHRGRQSPDGFAQTIATTIGISIMTMTWEFAKSNQLGYVSPGQTACPFDAKPVATG